MRLDYQWRSRYKKFWGGKHLTLGEQQYFCFGRCFSKRKMTRYAKNLESEGPPGFACVNYQIPLKSTPLTLLARSIPGVKLYI